MRGTRFHNREDDASQEEDSIKRKVTVDIEIDPKQAQSIKDNPYANWIFLAEAVNAWRIFPRIFISVYIYLLYAVVTWYIGLDNPSMEQSTLISVIVGAGAAWFGLYTGTGNIKISDKTGHKQKLQ